MAEGTNGTQPLAPEKVTVQVEYEPATGKIAIRGVTDENAMVACHILRDATDAVRSRIARPQLNLALGLAADAGKPRIQIARGNLPPFDDHGIRGGGR